MNLNIPKIGKIVGQLVLAAPAILSAIEPLIALVRRQKPPTSVDVPPPGQGARSQG